MSLVKLIAQADARGLAASGLACLDRCLPLLADDADVLRPLWAGVAVREQDWPDRLAASRQAVEAAASVLDAEPGPESGATSEPGPDMASAAESVALVRTMLASAPSEWAAGPLRDWAEICSVAALEIHQKLDAVGEGGSAAAAERLARAREDTAAVSDAVDGAEGADGVGPLVAGELRRQIRILEILAETDGPAGVRQAMDLSTEGQRVLRAVVSRRARAQG
ncbi:MULTISPECIES: hypothetical protein [unclassified Streptomyces]|uniref:hypothetical protein n=1 Tax=unclassified Streptomyces TaxID=2593676 RepID=UPI00081F3BE9|nr:MULTISPECIES: hypothetical protein [unclassified Streptomyces]MYZ37796.1 hypothetical protein [Streptomyces sp. SID4917]SCF94185.1 hypothetical protein GA0115259_105263 [Streptomyces sp. MnatMP-M17]